MFHTPVTQYTGPDRLSSLPPELLLVTLDGFFPQGLFKLLTFNYLHQLDFSATGMPAILFVCNQFKNDYICRYFQETILCFNITTSNLPLLAVVEFIVKLKNIKRGFGFRGIRLNIPTPYWHYLKDMSKLLRLSARFGAPFQYIDDVDEMAILQKESSGSNFVDSKFTVHFPDHYKSFISPFKHAFDIATYTFLLQTWNLPTFQFDWTVFDQNAKTLFDAVKEKQKPSFSRLLLTNQDPTLKLVHYGGQISAWVGPNGLLFPHKDLAVKAKRQADQGLAVRALSKIHKDWLGFLVLQLCSTVESRKRELQVLTRRTGDARMAWFNSLDPRGVEWPRAVQEGPLPRTLFQAFHLRNSIREAENHLASMWAMLHAFSKGETGRCSIYVSSSNLAATAASVPGLPAVNDSGS